MGPEILVFFKGNHLEKGDFFMSEKVKLLLDVREKPSFGTGVLLSFQHVFAMFGATILVPILTGYPVSVALFASGVGTIIYCLFTNFSVPVYLGSSFAYITAVVTAVNAMGGDISGAQTGLILVGVVYFLVALCVKLIGKAWIDKLLPPIVIGPMIIVIGLGLASSAVSNAGLVAGGDFKNIIVALFTFIATAFFSTKGKGFIKIIPFLCGILSGYVLACILGIVDFSPIMAVVNENRRFGLPEFALPFNTNGHFDEWTFNPTLPAALAMLPIAFVTISEHIGDHTVLGRICGKDFLKEPGLDRTLMGDGVATAVSAFLGGPANTTYGENTGVIGMTKIASVYVTFGAACIAIVISMFPIISAVIETIPTCVLGGMSILLYGVIASNGLKVLIDNRVNFGSQRNLIIASAMLVIGLGGAVFPIGNIISLSGTALSAIVGIILNLILPKE